jgi:hypothetical protein
MPAGEALSVWGGEELGEEAASGDGEGERVVCGVAV